MIHFDFPDVPDACGHVGDARGALCRRPPRYWVVTVTASGGLADASCAEHAFPDAQLEAGIALGAEVVSVTLVPVEEAGTVTPAPLNVDDGDAGP